MKGSGSRLLTAVLALGVVLGAAAPAAAGTVTFSLDPPTLLSYLRAVTPYELVVGKKGLSETLTFANPRDIRFEGGKVRLRLDVRGEPLPVEDVIEPVLTIRWNEVKKVWEAQVEKLPVNIPVLGTMDIAEHLRPITIPSVISQPAGEDGLLVDAKITSLRVLETTIQVSADLTFRRAAETPAAPPPPTKPASKP